MEPSGAITSSSSSIGFRQESVQVNNGVATLQWLTETISSRNRDKTLWKTPSKYSVPLSKKYPRVLEVELLSVEFPRTNYVIEDASDLYGCGNNALRFGEGFCIGHNDGCGNDRLRVFEYTEMPNACGPTRCPLVTQECTVCLPNTYTAIDSISSAGRRRVRVTTKRPHHFTLQFVSCMWITGTEEWSGNYKLCEITGPREFVAVCEDRDGDSSFSESFSTSSTQSSSGGCHGVVVIPRVPSPCALAMLVQKHLNHCAEPRTLNQYSVTFNPSTGKFIFDRSFGAAFFDVLAGTDSRSVFPTMGFAAVDYRYGSWATQNVQQTVLPSEQYQSVLRPTIASESVGESALVCVPAGNYTPCTLAASLTREMQRPLVCKGENDLLVAQLLGHCVEIRIPPGMYTPDTLIATVAHFLTKAYRELCRGSTEKFRGSYDCDCGLYELSTCGGAAFGLLFACSTLGALLGFPRCDMTGCSVYVSARPVFVPISNGRYTSGIYRVVADTDRLRFSIFKCGQYQAPIVKVERGDCTIKFSTWSCRHGGAAHGFQVGDLVRIDGPCDDKITGVHIVSCVPDAFTFLVGDDHDSDHSSSLDSVFEESSEDDKAASVHYVASHWDQPFYLHFPGVKDTISEVLGFPFAVSDRSHYEAPNAWNFLLRSEIFLNIQHLTDGEYSRISKTSDSGPTTKYSYDTLTSFVRIPLCTDSDCGLLATSSFARQKRFVLSTVDFAQIAVTVVGANGNLVNFNGRDHSFDLRFLTEQ